MNQKVKSELHDAEEAQRRFEALIRAALTTPPTPLKDIPRKRETLKRKSLKPSISGAASSSDEGDEPPQT